MIKTPFYLLLLLFLLAAYTASGEDSRSYKPYYEAINGAELSVVDQNFAQAYAIYSKAFDQFHKHHRTDLYNASLCAILSGNAHQAKLWMKELITLGFTLRSFEASIFKRLPPSEWGEIKSAYDSLHNLYRTGLDMTYLTALDTLRSREQRLVLGSQSRYDSLLYVHAGVLHRLITERGIPKGFEYGGQPLPMDVLRHHFGLRNRLKYSKQNSIDTTIEPYRSMNLRAYDLETLLRKAIFRGELTPTFVAACIDHSELDGTMRLGVFEVWADLNTKTITRSEPEQKELEAIDLHRTSLGLESCRDAARKDIYVALLYNQEKFPFDEYIRRSKEIGYTKASVVASKNNREEQDRLSMAFFNIESEINNAILSSDDLELKNSRDNNPVTMNKWELLKQFRIGKSIVVKCIKPLER